MSKASETSLPISRHSTWALALGALGIVFGDIGTSPLYALRECFDHSHGLALTPDNILGVLSLIVWTLVLTISIKYVGYVLMADNRGEGGILALMSLATARMPEAYWLRRWILVPLGLFGAALLYGDGAITPAISVLSAVEGLKIAAPIFSSYVVPITIVIMILLFFFQKQGTGRIGFVFGPIILVWFAVLGGLGLRSLINYPAVLHALNPYYAFQFFQNNGTHGFFVLGAVFLVVTGGEALYADMGHFGRRPIRLSWYLVAFPGLLLNYFGQGALLLTEPAAVQNPFYLMVPKEFLIPMVMLATAASVIASQALISGVFSVTRQAVQLGFMPRIRIVHTSSREIGQIYVPFVNWALLLLVVWLVLSFRSSSSLASAYGVAVTGTMMITTVLAAVVAYRRWRWKLWGVLGFVGIFLTIDTVFFITCALKIWEGGWVSIVLGIAIYIALMTWQQGRRVLGAYLKARSMPTDQFMKIIAERKPIVVPGTAIYMTGDPWGIPVALLHNLKHNKVLHENTLILTISTQDVPVVDKEERVRVEKIGPKLHRIFAAYGFMEMPKILEILDICEQRNIAITRSDLTFVLGRETILPSSNPGMMLWQEKLFALMARNALKPTAFFDIPPEQVIEVGIQVEI